MNAATHAIPLWVAIPAALMLIVSGLLALCGAVGLLRFTHFYPRVHAPTLGNTMGIGCALFAIVLIVSWLEQTPVVHVLIISVLLILVSPVTAILLMKAALRRDARQVIENGMPSETPECPAASPVDNFLNNRVK